jgi:hypothetical protein
VRTNNSPQFAKTPLKLAETRGKTHEFTLAKGASFCFNSSIQKSTHVNKTTNWFVASTAVLNESGNFTQGTWFEAHPHRACPKAFVHGIRVPVEVREYVTPLKVLARRSFVQFDRK